MSPPKASILYPEIGDHNRNLPSTIDRLIKGQTYKDLSTVCIIPTRGMIPVKVVQSWLSLMPAPNHKFMRLFATGMLVDEAYNQMIQSILDNPELAKWKYILCLEEDNIPPPDGLIKLYESIEGQVDGHKYDVMGGLYFTKGEGGVAQIWGNPKEIPLSFRPQLPVPQAIVPCNGTGQGFTLFRMSIFKNKDLPKPWFKTCAEWNPNVGTKLYTQDLYFAENALKLGYRFAVDCRVAVGHYDANDDRVW